MAEETITKVIHINKYLSEVWVEGQEDSFLLNHGYDLKLKVGDTIQTEDQDYDYENMNSDFTYDQRKKGHRSPHY